MAYTKSEQVVSGVTEALAAQFNDLRAELKAAAEGLLLSDNVAKAFAYSAGPGSDQLATITFVDDQADANLDLDAVTTFTIDANGFPTQAVTVFDKLGITLTEVYSETNGKLTSISHVLS